MRGLSVIQRAAKAQNLKPPWWGCWGHAISWVFNRVQYILLVLELALGLFSPGLCAADGNPSPSSPPTEKKLVFGSDVKHILAHRCFECHWNGKKKGGFQMDTRELFLRGGVDGAPVVIGKSAESNLIKRVSALVSSDEVMPPNGERLSEKEIQTLRTWIDQGLNWDGGQVVQFTRPDARWQRPNVSVGGGNPIDDLLAVYFKEKGFSPPSLIDDRLFMRRVYLDVVGLLPTPVDLQAFASDPRPDKDSRLVQRLLGDRKNYTEHWMSFWSDLLKISNSVDDHGVPIADWQKEFVDWTYAAIENNVPLDQFTTRILNPRKESREFLFEVQGFSRISTKATPELRAATDMTQVFLGTQLKCSGCHDSFVNPWTLKDTWGLAGVFAQKPLEMLRCDKPTGEKLSACFLFPEIGVIDSAQPIHKRLANLAGLVTKEENGRFSRTIVNRLWARFFGRGLVEPVDVMENEAWNSSLLNLLAADLIDNRYDLKKLMERILTSRAYRLPSVDAPPNENGFVFRGPLVKRMTAEQFLDAVHSLVGMRLEQLEQSSQPGPAPKAPKGKEKPKPVAANRPIFEESPGGIGRSRTLLHKSFQRALGQSDRLNILTTRENKASRMQALEVAYGSYLHQLLYEELNLALLQKRYPDTTSSAEWVERLYRITLGRKPGPEELRIASESLGAVPNTEGLANLIWVLLALPEFQLIL